MVGREGSTRAPLCFPSTPLPWNDLRMALCRVPLLTPARPSRLSVGRRASDYEVRRYAPYTVAVTPMDGAEKLNADVLRSGQVGGDVVDLVYC